MTKKQQEKLREALADSEHERWSRWQKHLFSRCKPGALGSLVIEADDVKRWTRQIETKYAELSEKEKDSDRKEADRTIEIMKAILSQRDGEFIGDWAV